MTTVFEEQNTSKAILRVGLPALRWPLPSAFSVLPSTICCACSGLNERKTRS